MRIHVEFDRCEGHGLCAGQAPQLFTLDDNAELTYHADGFDVPADQQTQARTAIASCPVAALREHV